MKMYYAIGAVSAVLIIIIVVRMFLSRKNDNYDFDSLSKQAPVPEPVEENEHTGMLDRLGKSLGVKNFHEVARITEELLRRGKKDEALAYLLSTTPLNKERAGKLITLFESRLKES